jgi:hypothetical protein
MMLRRSPAATGRGGLYSERALGMPSWGSDVEYAALGEELWGRRGRNSRAARRRASNTQTPRAVRTAVAKTYGSGIAARASTVGTVFAP